MASNKKHRPALKLKFRLRKDLKRYITFSRGQVGVIFAFPHSGTRPLTCAPRKRGTFLNDLFTHELALSLYKSVVQRGVYPYIVIFEVDRSFVDVNRGQPFCNNNKAYDSDVGKKAYDAYHNKIREFIAEIHQTHKHVALLLDMHGNSYKLIKNTICPCDLRGKTMKHTLKTYGKEAVYGKQSYMGQMARLGYPTFVINDSVLNATTHADAQTNEHKQKQKQKHKQKPSNIKQSPILTGGFTVHYYGNGIGIINNNNNNNNNNNANNNNNVITNVDVIQVEIHRKFRLNGKVAAKTGHDFAVGLCRYLKKYPLHNVKLTHTPLTASTLKQ